VAPDISYSLADILFRKSGFKLSVHTCVSARARVSAYMYANTQKPCLQNWSVLMDEISELMCAHMCVGVSGRSLGPKTEGY
jgi:hypothetical protein